MYLLVAKWITIELELSAVVNYNCTNNATYHFRAKKNDFKWVTLLLVTQDFVAHK